MTAVAKHLYDQAMTLTEDDRRKLAHDLLATVSDEDSEDAEPGAEEAWDEEIDKRIAEIDSGKVVGLSPAEMMEKLRAEHKWTR